MTNPPTPSQRIECERHHLLFQVTPDGIAIKCRHADCRCIYTITWERIEANRGQLVLCERGHGLFRPIATGIAIRCHAGECQPRRFYVVTWERIAEARAQIETALQEVNAGDTIPT